MADKLIICLIAFYVLIALVCGWEGNYWKALYWVSASSISVSVLMMK